MKRLILQVVGVLSLLLAAGSVLAQSNTVRVDIPFNFQIGGHALPAGLYRISPLGMTSEAFAVANEKTREADVIVPNKLMVAKPSATTKLVFRAYGDRYFLSQIWIEGKDIGRALPRTAVETRIAQEQSAHDVMVAAIRQ
jgi:hypothetical protein